ncbi:MAG TPA: type II toxin-antitoxin system VapC family toxin [Solirubrobacteraceae bacterium]
MLVVDTSAVVEALAGRAPDPRLVARLAGDGDLHAPHLVDVEVLHALRGLTRAGALSEDRANDARTDFADLAITRYPHERLTDRMWELRHNLTAYDAAFVALAEALGAPLVTCDAKLGATPKLSAAVEVYEPQR